LIFVQSATARELVVIL